MRHNDYPCCPPRHHMGCILPPAATQLTRRDTGTITALYCELLGLGRLIYRPHERRTRGNNHPTRNQKLNRLRRRYLLTYPATRYPPCRYPRRTGKGQGGGLTYYGKGKRPRDLLTYTSSKNPPPVPVAPNQVGLGTVEKKKDSNGVLMPWWERPRRLVCVSLVKVLFII